MTYGDSSNTGYPSNDGYPPRSGSGRARVPGPSSDYDDGYDSDGYQEAPPAPRSAASGAASARASVPGPSTGRASVGDAPTGRASVGSASVPADRGVRSGSGYDDYYDYESPSERSSGAG